MSLTALSRSRAFLRDGAYVTDPVLTDRAATYTPGVSERRGAATTFLHSGLKNADAQSGTTQTVAATRQSDAFGNLASSTGTWNGPFGYAGGFGYQEDATGLKLLGHRYYDSSTGRFLTRDPIKDGRNWYAYCDNDPINAADASGLIPHWLKKVIQVATDFWDAAGHVVKPGIKVITLIPAVVTRVLAIDQASDEANQYRDYKKTVEQAMEAGFDELKGQRLIKDNNPGVGGPFRVIQKFWELLIDAT
jgi:RHS repeat-associated protein